MRIVIILNLLFLLSSHGLISQKKQNIRGFISDENSLSGIKNATVQISGFTDHSTVTDTNGKFMIQLPVGKYVVVVTHPAYLAAMRENVVVTAGKEQIEDFSLQRTNRTFDAVTVKARQTDDLPLALWHIQQYAAVFYDPARVANTHAAIVNANDQANHLSVRGTSPNYIQWKIEDVEVVNPNHLENSGTMNDRPGLNGGGVSMLSAQMLQNSGFQFPSYEPLSGNALTGIFNMRLRRGNEEKREGVFQISLLGTDLSFEGPLNKKQNLSYLFNIRYSTIGILSGLGINFGNESSSYMDLSHNLHYSHKYGSVKIFGVAGKSFTDFRGTRDSTLAKTEKDLQDISYRSSTLIEGVSFLTSLSNSAFIKNVFAYSVKNSMRNSNTLANVKWLAAEDELYKQEKYASLHYFSFRLGNSFRIQAGSQINLFRNKAQFASAGERIPNFVNEQTVIEPYLSGEVHLLKSLEFRGGLHLMIIPALRYQSLQPRTELRYIYRNNQELIFKWGRSAQMQPLFLVMNNPANKNLAPTESMNYSFCYNVSYKVNTLKTEFFYQQFNSIPENLSTGFSSYNYFNEYITDTLTNTGKGAVKGIDLNFRRSRNGFYNIISANFYRSTYLKENVYRDARYNTGYNLAVTTGKEIKLKSGVNFISVDLRGIHHQGFLMSDEKNTNEYTTRLPIYARIDLRISYRRNKKATTSIWALDIQNVTNRKNVAYYYFDRVSNRQEIKYQLGMIPVLSYKLLF